MAMKWFCDVTGKEVQLAPAYEVVSDKDGKPLMDTVRQQQADGTVNVIQSARLKYLAEKGYFVRLSVDNESLQLVVSKEGLDKLMPTLSQTRAALLAEIEKKK